MKRDSSKTAGYDCTRECKHDPPGEHGISGGEWRYSVTDGAHAVSLMVLANEYPESVRRPLPSFLESLLQATMMYHTAQLDGNECNLLDCGTCSLDTSCLGGAEFWEKHGDAAQFEQPESFWLALEAEQAKLAAGEQEPGLATMLDVLKNYERITS